MSATEQPIRRKAIDLRDLRELILYATPSGHLGEGCRRYFAQAAARLGVTAAQTYPPHVSLTGFFQRADPRAGEVIDEINDLIATALPVPDGGIDVDGLVITEDWVGLEITSHWLESLVNNLIGHHRYSPPDYGIRPKDQLHLSLAYGSLPPGRSLDDYAELARDMLDLGRPTTWDINVWEHTNGQWTRHRLDPDTSSM